MATENSNPFSGAQPLAAFYPLLASDSRIRTALEGEFAEATPGIIAKLSSGEALSESELGGEDTIHDLVMNESEVEASIEALGAGVFFINILSFGGIFWVQAPEFDDIGYFETLEEAIAEAETEFEGFISEFKNMRKARKRNSPR